MVRGCSFLAICGLATAQYYADPYAQGDLFAQQFAMGAQYYPGLVEAQLGTQYYPEAQLGTLYYPEVQLGAQYYPGQLGAQYYPGQEFGAGVFQGSFDQFAFPAVGGQVGAPIDFYLPPATTYCPLQPPATTYYNLPPTTTYFQPQQPEQQLPREVPQEVPQEVPIGGGAVDLPPAVPEVAIDKSGKKKGMPWKTLTAASLAGAVPLIYSTVGGGAA